MKMLQEKDLVTDVKPFVTNELVLVVPKGQPKVELSQIATVKRIVLVILKQCQLVTMVNKY